VHDDDSIRLLLVTSSRREGSTPRNEKQDGQRFDADVGGRRTQELTVRLNGEHWIRLDKTQQSSTPSSTAISGPNAIRSSRIAPKFANSTAAARRSITSPSTSIRARKNRRRSTARSAALVAMSV
jgi:hypothetical protein